jgi:hypothetical protein
MRQRGPKDVSNHAALLAGMLLGLYACIYVLMAYFQAAKAMIQAHAALFPVSQAGSVALGSMDWCMRGLDIRLAPLALTRDLTPKGRTRQPSP